jgi:excisionase family DNA binding protein
VTRAPGDGTPKEVQVCAAPRSPTEVLGAASILAPVGLIVRLAGMSADIESLMSPEDVAKWCGLSKRAVYRAIERGELSASRLCHRLRVRPTDVEAWVEATRVTASWTHSPAGSRRGASGGLRGLLDEEP